MDIRLRNIILCLVNKHFPPSNTGRKRVEPEYVLDELLRVLLIAKKNVSMIQMESLHSRYTRLSCEVKVLMSELNHNFVGQSAHTDVIDILKLLQSKNHQLLNAFKERVLIHRAYLSIP